MTIKWITPAGNIQILEERITIEIVLEAESDIGNVEYSLISGRLPRGLRLDGNIIKGSPVEVIKFTTSRFVIRATDENDIKDRTFSLSVDGSDAPEWVTREGFLKVGNGDNFFVLDNARVDFKLEAVDSDITAGDKIEFYLVPNSGELPPGLSLSRDGVISGFTEPILSVQYRDELVGAYDTGSFDTKPLDSIRKNSNGYDTFFFDTQTFDYNEPSQAPRKLSRFYTFSVAVTDEINTVTRIFKIFVVSDEFLKADNNLVQVDTNLFRADNSAFRVPLWITRSNLGRYRANNYLTIFLDVYNPPSLPGTITFFLLPKNPNGSDSELPEGMILDSVSGDIAGRLPYQRKITRNYEFTVLAVNFSQDLANIKYTLVGNWSSRRVYGVGDAVVFSNNLYICTVNNTNRLPTDENFWVAGTSSAEKTFNIDIIGEIESGLEWISNSDLGVLKPNLPSTLFVEAKNLLNDKRGVVYELISGSLPPGLEFFPNGLINGKVKQFSDETGNGLTRFFDSTSEDIFDVAFDNGDTTFDKIFRFTVKSRDSSNASELIKSFFITVVEENVKTFSNVYLLALQTREKRLEWFDFITDTEIFSSNNLYRYGDVNFGVQSDLKVLIYAGIESTDAVKFVQAMSRNHYRKRLLFGDIKLAKAKDPETQETVYEVIYCDIVDDFEKNGKSISQTMELPDKINSPVLISYDSIKVDSDIPLVSDRDHQRLFPNSIRNMRRRVREVGDRNREFLPLWMRSIQDQATYELGYTKSLVICYAKPGQGDSILRKINSKINFASRGDFVENINYQVNDTVLYLSEIYTCISPVVGVLPSNKEFWTKNFNFKSIDFDSDRYLIDAVDQKIQTKYLAFPQTGEKLP